MQNVHLLAGNAAQSQYASLQIHDLRENLVVWSPQSEDIVFETVDAFVEVVEHGRIEVNHLVQDLVQEVSGATLARHGGRAQLLFYVIDAAKHVVVISDDVVGTEKSVELDRVETIGAGVGSHAVYDEINVILKLLDLGIVAILSTVFHRQRVKLEDIEQHLFIFGTRLFHI